MKPSSPRYPTYVIYEGYDRALALESVGKGWSSLIDEVFNYIEQNRVHSKVIQVKEKFGGLRVYTDVVHEGLDEVIRNVGNKSFKICEDCGAAGVLRSGGWVRTLCDTHANGKPPIPETEV